jgi:hypothetical protein
MTQQSFPSRVPAGLLFGVLFGLLSCVPCIAVWRVFQEPVRAYYLKTYLHVSLPHLKSEKPKLFLMLVRNAGMVARSDSAAVPACRNSDVFLTRSADEDGLDGAGRCALSSRSKPVSAWLRNAVYGGQSVTQLLRTPLATWGIVALCLVMAGGSYDSRQRQRARDGIKLRGPDLVSRWQFNRRVKGDGFPIVLENPRNPLELLRGQRGKVLRIRLRDENKNIITMSDPGGGKTSIMMQILDEVERRG